MQIKRFLAVMTAAAFLLPTVLVNDGTCYPSEDLIVCADLGAAASYVYQDVTLQPGEGNFTVATARCMPVGSFLRTTWSDDTEYNNGYGAIDPLVTVQDGAGNRFAICGTNDAVLVVPEDKSRQTVFLSMPDYYEFGGAAMNDAGEFYILWGKDVGDMSQEEAVNSDIVSLIAIRYAPDGTELARCELPLSQTFIDDPFRGTASLCIHNGVLACFYNMTWVKNHFGDQIIHQGSQFLLFDPESMEPLAFSEYQGSHSFGTQMLPTDYGFAGIQLNDADERGININTYYAKDGTFQYNYLTKNGKTYRFHCPGQYGTNDKRLDGNPTYIHVGGLAHTGNTYMIAGRSQHYLNSAVTYKENEHVTDKYDVFVRVMDSKFGESDAFNGEDRVDQGTGEVVDRHVVWLTSLAENEEAGQVKITALNDGSYCVLWEHFTDGAFDGIRYVILDENGYTLRSETPVLGGRLSDTSIQPIADGDTLRWAILDTNDCTVTWYSFDLNTFGTASDIVTDTPEVEFDLYDGCRELAAAEGLDFVMEDGCYGECNINLAWVFLKESGTLLIGGSGIPQVQPPDNTNPWAAVLKDIKTVRMSDTVTGLQGCAFEGASQLTDIRLSPNLRSIGGYTFRGCTNLASIELPDSLRTIGSDAFEKCHSLEQLDIPDGVTTIGMFAFNGCENLQSVHLPESLTAINDHLFSGCVKLSEVNIPPHITAVKNDAFQSCALIEELPAS